MRLQQATQSISQFVGITVNIGFAMVFTLIQLVFYLFIHVLVLRPISITVSVINMWAIYLAIISGIDHY